jgi:phage baseplate assembly protein W
MPARAFSVEDGNIGNTTIVTARTRAYSDIDLSFAKKGSGDVFKKQHAAAVKQAVRNLLLTNYSEKPFMPDFGGDLTSMLFRLSTEIDDDNLEDDIIKAIETYEPRAEVLNINTIISPDSNEVRVTVTFKVISTQEETSVEINLTRLR